MGHLAIKRVPSSLFCRMRPWSGVLVLAAAMAGTFFIGQMVAHTDRRLRAQVLQTTRAAAKAMALSHVRALSGTKDDLYTPHFRVLRDELAAVRAANPQCRLVYLLGRRFPPADGLADGAAPPLFIYADSEPVDSPQYSPPGEDVEQSSPELSRAFAARPGLPEGAVVSRRGGGVSALAPLEDPQAGEVVAVLGMDFEPHVWRWHVATEAAFPAVLMLVLMVGVVSVLIVARPFCRESGEEALPRPVLRRLLRPIAVLFTLLLLLMGAIMCLQQRHHLGETNARVSADIDNAVRTMFERQVAHMRSMLQVLAADRSVTDALRAGDMDGLTSSSAPHMERLACDAPAAQLCYLGTNRICLLRVHAPTCRGDLVSHATVLEAERTGRAASGLELGLFGLLSMRVAQPVYSAGTLVGYVEMGMEVAGSLSALRLWPDVQLIVLLRKEYLARSLWEEGMRRLGRTPEWDRWRQNVVVYTSGICLDDKLGEVYDSPARDEGHGGAFLEVACGGKVMRVSAVSLQDAAGRQVGRLLALRDISGEKAAFRRLLAMSGAVGGVLLTMLLAITYVLLSRADAGIRVQEASLRQFASELRAMAARLQDIREEERSALARELHDSLGQQLTAFALHFELMCMDCEGFAAQSRELADVYDRLVAMLPQIESVTALTQRICASLKPGVLDELGLVSAIEAQVEEAAARGRLGYSVALPAGEIELNRSVALALFRIAQEALANVVRHAHASHVSVELRAAGGAWILEVVDNGCGFVAAASADSRAVGLLGMRERAAAVGGAVDVLSAPGRGTTVRVEVPAIVGSTGKGGEHEDPDRG